MQVGRVGWAWAQAGAAGPGCLGVCWEEPVGVAGLWVGVVACLQVE